MRIPPLRIFLMGILLMAAATCSAQDSTQKQIWPELEAYFRINQKFRLYTLISGTKSNSEYTDGTAGIYIDYFTMPWLRNKNFTEMHDSTRGYFLWFRTGYSYSNSPPGEKPKAINIWETESDATFLLPASIILINRNRIDWRWVNGEFQPIYRPRLKFVRNFKTDYLTFNAYAWSEYFYYWNDNTQSRLRIAAGAVIKVLTWLDFETYYMHQFQNKQYVAPLNAVGIQFDFYFKSKNYK